MAGMKKRRKTSRRRRRISGVSKLPTQQLLLMAAGALVAAKVADPLLSKIPVKMVQDDQKVRDGIKAGLGVFLATQKNEMAANAGLGMAAYGIANLLSGYIPNLAISGTGRYQGGTGPTFLGSLGPQANYLQGIERWDGIGTEPDMISGDFSPNGGLEVV